MWMWNVRFFLVLFLNLPFRSLPMQIFFADVRSELKTGSSAMITPLRFVNTQCPGCSRDTPTTLEWGPWTRTESAKLPACRTPSPPWTPLSSRSFTVGWTAGEYRQMQPLLFWSTSFKLSPIVDHSPIIAAFWGIWMESKVSIADLIIHVIMIFLSNAFEVAASRSKLCQYWKQQFCIARSYDGM